MAEASGEAVLPLSDDQERLVVYALQAVLVGVLVLGVVTGDPRVVANALGAIGVSLLPALLRREVGLRVDPGLLAWLVLAAVLHAVGILGPYRNVWWYDYLTHALSAAVVTGAAYAVVVALEREVEGLSLPGVARPAVLVVFAVALAVAWEAMEFGFSTASEWLGTTSPLIVFGPGDIVTDIVFSTLGGVLVALGGHAYLGGLARKVARRVGG